MKIIVLTTGTNNTLPLYEPLKDLGHAVTVITYDAMSYDEHDGLPATIRKARPDFVLYIGAIEEHHGKPVVSADVLGEIGAAVRLVHLCCDGAEPYWWEQLDRYYDVGRFALQINIDGMRTGPIGDRGMTVIPPTDLSKFKNKPWGERSVLCGFSGGLHAGRHNLFLPLAAKGLLHRRARLDGSGYDEFRAYIEDCKIGINAAQTGGGVGGLHVKYRASGELPGAGCLVLETAGSPLADWFVPGEEYLEYQDADDAEAKIEWARRHQREARAMALRMRKRVEEEHSPAVFWSQVFDRLGIGDALAEARETKCRHWVHMDLPQFGAPRKHAPGTKNGRPNLHGNGAPRLVDSYKSVNLVEWNGKVWTVPQRLGEIHLDLQHRHPMIKDFATLETARASIK